MKSEIKKFIEDWKKIRGKTLDFLEKIPDKKMNWSPHKLLGTFGMQIRHIGKSQESYIKGIKSGKINFSNKSFDLENSVNYVTQVKNSPNRDSAKNKQPYQQNAL